MVDFALLAVATTAGLLLAPASTTHTTPNFAPPRLMDSVQFDPEAFLDLGPNGMIPSDLMALDGKFGANGALRGMMLESRNAHENGAFYRFSDPLNPSARASLYLRDGRLTGAIYSGGDMRTVLTSEDVGLSHVSFEDARLDLPCGTDGHDMPNQPQPLDGGVAGACDNGTKVDVLVVYTDGAVAQAGSEASLLDSISWAIGDSNAIYAGSGVGLSARLVGTSRLTGYVQSGNMEVDLDRLSNPGDGFIDGVHALRNAVGADLVAMVRSDGGGYCGIAWLLPSNSSAQSAIGFSVCALGCFSNLSFTHELAHNMGCCHAPGDGGGCTTGGVFSYSVGHRFTGTNGTQYRTVMAYAPGTRIPRFSSPGVTWAGTATGIAGTRDNARTINETALAFTNFRCSADGVGSCGSGGGCFSVHAPPGCNTTACCEAVCAIDSYCCLTTWDAICVSEALELCSNCGEGSAGSCFVTHTTPSCDNASCCGSVCAVDPFCCTTQWDSICVAEAVDLCPNCGDPETGSCYLVHGTPFCDNAACCDGVCAADPFCCATMWDSLCSDAAIANCAGCGNPNALSCYEPHTTPYCADAACCNVVCTADPFCCNNQWDSLCSGAAVKSCPGCGNPSGGNCYEAHGAPYCADAACCAQVCDIDAFCCNVAWDSLCANEAMANCPGCGNPSAGSCYSTHTTPYCADLTCCETVCAADPFCCNNQWDGLCAGAAATNCPGCGNPNAGSCYAPHGTPYCADATCCETVCAADPFCCNNQWDSLCSGATVTACPSCENPLNGSCFEAHATPNCNDATCCEAVCAADSFCCDTSWDSLCAGATVAACPNCENPLNGSCFEAHTTPNCNEAACCSQVCGFDPFCCNTMWDTICANEANTTCVNACGGSLTGSCCVAHANPYCDDASCCTTVCAEDPFCCNTQWDTICASEAASMCASCAPPCPADFNNDGNVNAADLSILLGDWGGSGADLNDDNFVNAADLAILLSSWGFCP